MIKESILCKIPSVDELLKQKDIEKLVDICSRSLLVQIIRDVLSEYRNKILSLDTEDLEFDLVDNSMIIKDITEAVDRKLSNNLRPVVNATGVIIHTNIGRSPLSDNAIDSLLKISKGYSNLEMDLVKGERGVRYEHVEELLKELTKAESAMVVNNNAAAVMLTLSTMAKNKEVIVSRGQLIEIGGSFRIPDVMRESGAKLVEVGTTNKTHIQDYERAINEETGIIMKVHTSNYRIMGFTEEVSGEELVSLGRKKGLPVIEDIGSGIFVDLRKYGLPYEPTVQNSIAFGMDVVTFSGDKMLGGPQAGIIVGKKKFIDAMKRNPLTRAFRIDKLTLAALEGTLKLYFDEEKVIKNIPILSMLTANELELTNKAEKLYRKLQESVNNKCILTIEDEYSEVGGGAMPLTKLATKAITVFSDSFSANALEESLRYYKTPIITRIKNDKIYIDVRTVREEEYGIIANALKHALDKNHRK